MSFANEKPDYIQFLKISLHNKRWFNYQELTDMQKYTEQRFPTMYKDNVTTSVMLVACTKALVCIAGLYSLVCT